MKGFKSSLWIWCRVLTKAFLDASDSKIATQIFNHRSDRSCCVPICIQFCSLTSCIFLNFRLWLRALEKKKRNKKQCIVQFRTVKVSA